LTLYRKFEDKTGSEPQNVSTAFHSLENKLVDCHLQYSQKIGNLVSAIEKMEAKMLAQQKSQEELSVFSSAALISFTSTFLV
jgi:hypothetical protein